MVPFWNSEFSSVFIFLHFRSTITTQVNNVSPFPTEHFAQPCQARSQILQETAQEAAPRLCLTQE